VQCNREPEGDIDDILLQYREYSTATVVKQLSTFQDFDPAESRLDFLLFDMVLEKKSYCKLWNIV